MNPKKLKRSIAITVLVCALIYGVIHGIGAIQCYKTLNRFETACNELDIGKALNCLNPTLTVTVIKGIWAATQNVEDIFSSEEVQNVLDHAMDLLEIELPEATADYELTDFEIDIKTGWMHVGLSKAHVKSTVLLNVNGVEFEKQIQINLVKNNNKWYLSGLELLEE